MAFVVSVTIHVVPAGRADFIAASHDNARNSRLEPGCRQFDLSQAIDNPDRFHLYEVYDTPEDFAKHQQTAHYARWRAAVDPLMQEKRVGVKLTRLEE